MMQHDTTRIRLRHIVAGTAMTLIFITLSAIAGAIEKGLF